MICFDMSTEVSACPLVGAPTCWSPPVEPDPRFVNQPPVFWANVRTISQEVGYTERGRRRIKVPSPEQISAAYRSLDLSTHLLFSDSGHVSTAFGQSLLDYFRYRAEVLEDVVEPALMDAEEARHEFDRLRAELNPTRPFVQNKQRGEKAGPALLTGLVNMILKSEVGDDCDYDPRTLTTVTSQRLPVRTLARRVDGAYPSTVNPVAIWEIKEYYHTTTFGSRVADGVYETLLDGMELEELNRSEGIHVRHILIIDSHYTWWEMGRSYLCRMVDIMHMGYVDEVLFGREVLTRLPLLAREWVRARTTRDAVPREGLSLRAYYV